MAKHTSGRWSLATCIGQSARLQHFEHHATSVLVGQYRSLATNDQNYILAITGQLLVDKLRFFKSSHLAAACSCHNSYFDVFAQKNKSALIGFG